PPGPCSVTANFCTDSDRPRAGARGPRPDPRNDRQDGLIRGNGPTVGDEWGAVARFRYWAHLLGGVPGPFYPAGVIRCKAGVWSRTRERRRGAQRPVAGATSRKPVPRCAQVQDADHGQDGILAERKPSTSRRSPLV